jgi:hypothetical protein
MLTAPIPYQLYQLPSEVITKPRNEMPIAAINGAKVIDPNRKIFQSYTIPENSPIYSLQSLKTGWDGYWAKPLSQEVLFKANRLWTQIEQIKPDVLPVIRPAANGSVAFTWTHNHPTKELEIWLYDQPDYYAEWMLSFNDGDEENISKSQADLLKLIRRYQEL